MAPLGADPSVIEGELVGDKFGQMLGHFLSGLFIAGDVLPCVNLSRCFSTLIDAL